VLDGRPSLVVSKFFLIFACGAMSVLLNSDLAPLAAFSKLFSEEFLSPSTLRRPYFFVRRFVVFHAIDLCLFDETFFSLFLQHPLLFPSRASVTTSSTLSSFRPVFFFLFRGSETFSPFRLPDMSCSKQRTYEHFLRSLRIFGSVASPF